MNEKAIDFVREELGEDNKAQDGFSNVLQRGPLDFSIQKRNYKKFMDFVDKFNLTSTCDFHFSTFKTGDDDYFINEIRGDSEIIYNWGSFNKTCCMFLENYIIEFYVNTQEKYKTLNFKAFFNSKDYTPKEVKNVVKNKLENILDVVNSINITWYYTANGSVSTSCFEEVIDDTILNEAYPFIPNMFEYIDNFLTSNESTLLLFGDPGTGKTRFIRYLMKTLSNKYKESYTLYTTDVNVLERDDMFLSFIQHNTNRLLILEDIDHNLKSRISGNVFMYKLLSSSDGIIQHNNKKIVLSTNLTSLENIDEALLRVGRCYDIINFRKLTPDESKIFLSKFDVDISEMKLDKESYSLAELYAITNKKHITRNNRIIKKVGFE